MADCISRDKAAKVLCMACGNSACDPFECSFYKKMEEVPAADVRPVIRGKWKPAGGSVFPMYACSQCHAISLGGNFCSNCGADMREVTP